MYNVLFWNMQWDSVCHAELATLCISHLSEQFKYTHLQDKEPHSRDFICGAWNIPIYLIFWMKYIA